MTVPLEIRFRPRNAHDDLLLSVASQEHLADSYFFQIDDSPTAPPTTEGALACLLDQWLDDLADLGGGGAVFLPFGLFDQCSLWLRVSRLDVDRVRVDLGWTSVEGWSFVPSCYGSAASMIGAFKPIDGAAFDAELADLVTRVRAIRDTFRTA